MIQEINENLLVSLNSLTQYPLVESIIYVFADAPIFFLPIFLITAWIYYKKNTDKKHDLLFILYSCIIAIIISLIIQQFVDIARPETALGNSAKLILDHIPDASFPSDHATVSFAFLGGLLLAGYISTAWVFLILAMIMNLSRIAAGVHWPLDILAGSIVGIIASLLVFKVLKQIGFVKNLNLFIIKLGSYLKL